MLDDRAVLGSLTDRAGDNPLSWVAAPLAAAGRVLEIACTADVLADRFPTGQWLGLTATLRPGPMPRLRGSADALPVRGGAFDGIALLLGLPRLPNVDGVFAELRRVLQPGGTLVLLVPSALARSTRELRMASTLAGVHRQWRHRSALDQAGWLLAAADFAVLGDDRVSFSLPLPDQEAAQRLVEILPRAGLWPPDLPSGVRERAVTTLCRLSGPGRILPVPLRRLVARR